MMIRKRRMIDTDTQLSRRAEPVGVVSEGVDLMIPWIFSLRSSMGHSVIFLEVVEVKQGTGGSVVAICATILKLLWRKVPGGFPKRSNLKSSSVVNPAEDRGRRGQGELRPAPLVRDLELWSREWRGLVESSGSKWCARTAMGQAR